MTADSVPDILAKACSEVREAGPDDAVAVVRPRYVASPADVTEAAAVMRAAAAEGMIVVPRGAGTKLAWGCAPTGCDLVIDTRRMNRVLEHAVGDQVVRVQAGVGLDQLAAVLAGAGQRLALDPAPPTPRPLPRSPCTVPVPRPPHFPRPPHPLHSPVTGAASPPGSGSPAGDPGSPGPAARNDSGAGTVGGVLSTGTAGPLRLRYGTPRDLAIGITVVRADGTVASSGGKVVKNVAGYDLGKLFAGSYGTLGLIVEAAFRLHPLPGAASFVTLDCADAAAARAAVAAAADSPLAPSAAEIDRPSRRAPIRVGVLLEGDPDGVAERAARMAELLGASGASARPAWWGRGAAAAADGTVIRIAFWAAALTEVLRAVDTAASTGGLDPAVSGSAAAGVIYAAVDEHAAPAAVSEFVLNLRAAVQGGAAAGPASPASGPTFTAAGPPSRGSVVVLHAPSDVRDAVDLWGLVPSLGLMRAVKDQFDPDHRMAPGRFAGGI